ncbi:aspartate aminotransferase family protein [Micromonospora zamorensis]|uniref:aspartate aminotransferase family protein n=1 Tax=Micromonospora zamorensis TaxID=709883 RepID=UPI003D95D9D9
MADSEEGRTVYPRYFGRASGAYLWDVDGTRYIDYQLGYGPVVLGHADARVNAAAIRELESGSCFAPLWSPRQVELTEMLNSVIPGGELTYLLKTGSDANSAAVRLARIHTGRTKVVRWGYNGWHDWAVGLPAGVPSSVRDETLTFEHDPASLRAVFERYPDEIACVLTMPFEFEVIPPERLKQLRSIAHEYGALFVLDEMRSGFRMSLGGAQEYFGVQADIVALSKAMANGHPISAVVGRADVLGGFSRTRISSTFFAGPAEMAAALTTISILRDTDAIARIWSLGEKLQNGLRDLVAKYDVAAEVVGYPPIPFLRFAVPDEKALQLRRAFFVETTRRGILLHPEHQWFISASHRDEDIEFTLDVCRQSFESLADLR